VHSGLLDDGSRPAIRGRSEESALLEELGRADPTGRVLLIAGEPGIGKSRLLAHAIAIQRGAGRRVVAQTCAEAEAEMPYAGLVGPIGHLVDDFADSLPSPQLRAIERTLLRAHGPGEAEAHTVAAGLLSLFQAVLATGPLVVAIDDLQWLDAESDRCLAYALRRLDRTGLLLLLAARDDSPLARSRVAPVPSALSAAVADRIELVRLGPLDDDAAHAVLVDNAAAGRTRDDDAETIARTGGNPFWLLAFARSRREAHTAGGVPDTPALRSLTRERFEALDPAVLDVATTVAVLGRPRLKTLERAVRDVRYVDRLDHLLDTTIIEGLLVSVEGRLAPAHPVIGTALLAQLAPFRRRRAHLEAADLAESPEERAQHLLRARDAAVAIGGHDGYVAEDVLLGALDAASAAAERRGDLVRATWFADRACEVGTDLVTGPGRSAARIVRAGELHARAGDFGRAREVLGGLDLSTLDDAVFERVALVLGDATLRSKGAAACRAFLHEIEDSLARAGGGSLRRQAAVATVGADRQLGLGDRTERAERAVALGGTGGSSPGVLTHALARLLMARVDRGFVAEDVLRRIGDLAARPASQDVESGASEGLCCFAADDLDGARAAFARLRRRMLDHGDDFGAQHGWLATAVVEFAAGRTAGASAALEHVRTLPFPEAGLPLTLKALIALGAGDEGVAEDLLCGADDAGEWFLGTGPDHLRGLLALRRGDTAAAAEHLDRFLSASNRVGVVDPQLRFAADVDLAEARLRLGELRQVARIADHLHDIAERSGRATTRGQERRLRAQIVLHDAGPASYDVALERAQEALALHAVGPRPVEHGRSLFVVGDVLRRLGRLDDARKVHGEAREVLIAAGHPDLARRLGARGSSAPTPLSPAEHSVAALVADGYTNRETAAQLGLSVRTVENHLQAVYRKLGIGNRDELSKLYRATAHRRRPQNL
jgi:DNA-binding CsgD family transcriptional regulator